MWVIAGKILSLCYRSLKILRQDSWNQISSIIVPVIVLSTCEILRDRGPNSAQILCPWPVIYRNSYKILLFLISQKSFQNINRDAENHTLFPSTQSASVSLTSHQFRNHVAHHLWNTNKWGELSSRPHDSPLCVELFNSWLGCLLSSIHTYNDREGVRSNVWPPCSKKGQEKSQAKHWSKDILKCCQKISELSGLPPTRKDSVCLCLWALSSVLWSCFSFHNVDTAYIVSIVWLVSFLSV